jgi:hypothetical protein
LGYPTFGPLPRNAGLLVTHQRCAVPGDTVDLGAWTKAASRAGQVVHVEGELTMVDEK